MSGLIKSTGRRYTVTEIIVGFKIKDDSIDYIVSHMLDTTLGIFPLIRCCLSANGCILLFKCFMPYLPSNECLLYIGNYIGGKNVFFSHHHNPKR